MKELTDVLATEGGPKAERLAAQIRGGATGAVELRPAYVEEGAS